MKKLQGILDEPLKPTPLATGWRLPKVEAGPIKVPLDKLREKSRDEESLRGFAEHGE